MRQPSLSAFCSFLCLLWLCCGSAWAQVPSPENKLNIDTIQTPPPPVAKSKDDSTRWYDLSRPQRIALYSALLPGLGQCANKEYWKLPIIYGGAGALTYFLVRNNRNYQTYRRALISRLDNDTNTADGFANLSTEQILRYRDAYRRDRDFTIILSTLAYLLQIADAHVFAHLKDFNVNDNLSVSPPQALILPGSTPGIGLTFHLH